MARTKSALIFVLLLSGCQIDFQADDPEIRGAEIHRHIEYLASDRLEGRETGSPGCEAAENYIARLLESYGLEAVGEAPSFFQSFAFTAGVAPGENNRLAVGPGEGDLSELAGEGYRPYPYAKSADFEGPAVRLSVTSTWPCILCNT